MSSVGITYTVHHVVCHISSRILNRYSVLELVFIVCSSFHQNCQSLCGLHCGPRCLVDKLIWNQLHGPRYNIYLTHLFYDEAANCFSSFLKKCLFMVQSHLKFSPLSYFVISFSWDGNIRFCAIGKIVPLGNLHLIALDLIIKQKFSDSKIYFLKTGNVMKGTLNILLREFADFNFPLNSLLYVW